MSQHSPYDEKELFVRIAGGDEAAFRTIFHHYNKLLLPFMIKLTGSITGAEEVLQEVFIRIWLHREKLHTIESPKAWIVRIASNLSLNYLRKIDADNRLFERFHSQPAGQASTTEQNFDAKEITGFIHQAVENLSPQCRQVYKLSREQGMTIPEIAEAMKASPNTVKNQLIKALKEIREHIKKAIGAILFALLGGL
ncbi:MAG: RNA polymerase sigma-70 factor [Chitinophagaceae bacterium]